MSASTFGRCCVRDCCGPGSQCCSEAEPHWHMQDESILFHDELPRGDELVDASTICDPAAVYAIGRTAVGPTMGELRAAGVDRMVEPLRDQFRSIAAAMLMPTMGHAIQGAAEAEMAEQAERYIAAAGTPDEEHRGARFDQAFQEYLAAVEEGDITTDYPFDPLSVAWAQFRADLGAALAPLLYGVTERLSLAVAWLKRQWLQVRG